MANPWLISQYYIYIYIYSYYYYYYYLCIYIYIYTHTTYIYNYIYNYIYIYWSRADMISSDKLAFIYDKYIIYPLYTWVYPIWLLWTGTGWNADVSWCILLKRRGCRPHFRHHLSQFQRSSCHCSNWLSSVWTPVTIWRMCKALFCCWKHRFVLGWAPKWSNSKITLKSQLRPELYMAPWVTKILGRSEGRRPS